MLKPIHIFLFLLLVTRGFSQSINVRDSLKMQIANSNEDTLKINLMMTLGILLEEEHPQEALKIYQEGAKLSRKIKSPQKEFTSLINQGIANFLLGKWDSAIFAYNKAYAIANDLGLKEKMGVALVDIGNVYLAINQYPEAIEYYQKAEPYLNSRQTGTLFANMIDIFNKIGRYKEMMEYGNKAIQLAAISLDTVAWLDAHINMFSEKNDTLEKSGFELLKKALPVAHRKKDKYRLQAIYNNMAIYYTDIPQYYDSALWCMDRCEELKRIDNAQSGMIDVYMMRAKVYLKKKDFVASKKNGLLALALAPKTALVTHWEHIYQNLALAEEGMKNYPSSVGFFKKYTFYRDSVETLRKSELSAQLDARYQSEKKEREIDQLERQKEKQEQGIRFRNLIIQFGVMVFAFLLLIAFLFYRNIKNKQRLVEQQKEIQSSKIVELEKDKQLVISETIVKSQEEERGRVAKDLHDGLGGMLWGVKLSLFNMKGNMILSNEHVQIFERSLDMLDNSIHELRRVAHNLMPEALVKFGLTSSLKDFCDFVNSSNVVRVIFQQVGTMPRFDLSVEVVLYRVVNELVNNALRHASAKEIIVQINYDAALLTLTVEDNGVGFDQALLAKAKGAGWPNIKSRIAFLKGTLDVETSPGNGTAINITISI